MTLTTRQYDILNRYARGSKPADIAYALGIGLPEVNAAVGQLCGHDKARAHEVLAEEDTRRRPASVAAAFKGALVVATADDLFGPPGPVAAATLEEVLAAGEQHDQPRIRSLARRARALVDDLAARIEVDRTRAEAAERVAELKAQLAEAEAALKPGGKRRPAAAQQTAAAAAAVDARAVRRWAADNHVDCNATGRIRRDVLDAYCAAVNHHG